MNAVETPASDRAEEEGSITGQQAGERLRQARESSGLSLEEIAIHLHLGVDKIAALERGETQGIAAPVFLAGYLRAYAKKVGLPGDEIVAAYSALSTLATPPIESAREDFRHVRSRGAGLSIVPPALRQWLGWGVLILVVLAGAAWVWSMMGDEPVVAESGSEANRETLALPQAVMPQEESAVVGSAEGNTPEIAMAAEPVSEAPVIEAPKLKEPKLEGPGTEALAPRVQIALSYREDSWTEVRDAQGNRLMHRLGKAGENYTIKGVAPFELVLGYAPGVDLRYNGEPYDLSRYKNRRLVKFSVGKSGDGTVQDQQ